MGSTYYDAARLAFGRKGTNAALAGQQLGAPSVTYGTVLADSKGGTVKVHLDSSEEGTAVELSLDAPVSKGDRVKVTTQGGSYAVVALAGVAQAASDAQDSADAAAERAEEVAGELSYAMRVTSEGLEVGLKKDGKYTGARVVLSPSGLVFKPESGLFDLASFTADAVTLGTVFDQNVRITRDGFFITDQGFSTRFAIGTGGGMTHVQSQQPVSLAYMDGVSTVACLDLDKATLADGTKAACARLSAYGASGAATLSIDSAGWASLSAPDGSTLLDVSPSTGVSCDLKAGARGSKVLVKSSVTAYRHMGWVVVRFDNYAPWTAAVTSPTSKAVGTLPEGWRPPERFKGALYPGSADYSAMAYVDTGGKVSVYSSALGANQQLSGYVVYPATQ